MPNNWIFSLTRNSGMHKEWKRFDKLKHPTIICCNAGVESLMPSETNFGISWNSIFHLAKYCVLSLFFDFGSATLSKPCYSYYGQNNRLHTFTIPLDFSHCRNGVWHTKRIIPDKAHKTCCPNMHPQHIALYSQSTKFREYNNMQSAFNFLWKLITLFRRTTLFHIY